MTRPQSERVLIEASAGENSISTTILFEAVTTTLRRTATRLSARTATTREAGTDLDLQFGSDRDASPCYRNWICRGLRGVVVPRLFLFLPLWSGTECANAPSSVLPSGQSCGHLPSTFALPFAQRSVVPPQAPVWRSRALQHDPSALRGALKGQPVVTVPQLGPWQPGSTKKHWPLRPILVPSGQVTVIVGGGGGGGGSGCVRACGACRHALVVAAKLLLLSRRAYQPARATALAGQAINPSVTVVSRTWRLTRRGTRGDLRTAGSPICTVVQSTVLLPCAKLLRSSPAGVLGLKEGVPRLAPPQAAPD